jgi:hypothetical protein
LIKFLKQAEEGYDPRKSKVSDERMDIWRAGTVTGDLLEVPGIGPAAKAKLADDPMITCRITNTYQLIGQYLMLKGPDEDGQTVSVGETNKKFWFFLKMKGISSHRSAIVLAISEKVASFFTGFYDANAYDDDEEEE